MKYLLIVTLVLFAVVFTVTRFNNGDEKDGGTISEESNPQNENTQESSSDENLDEKIPMGDEDLEIDNKWAMFLVNNTNPLPASYDSMIETSLVFTDYREYFMDSRMADYAINMIEDAKKDGIDLLMVSAYRTFDYQQQNFDSSLQDRIDGGMSYEDAFVDVSANVATPGKSEHNAGLAADIMCASNTNMDDDSFEDTKEFEWLQSNAHKYGFILRYPKDKTEITGIIYEPWHYRFVGLHYAGEMKKLGMCLEEYYEYRGWVDENGKAIAMRGPFEEENPLPPSETSGSDKMVSAETEPPKSETTAKHSEQSAVIVV